MDAYTKIEIRTFENKHVDHIQKIVYQYKKAIAVNIYIIVQYIIVHNIFIVYYLSIASNTGFIA